MTYDLVSRDGHWLTTLSGAIRGEPVRPRGAPCRRAPPGTAPESQKPGASGLDTRWTTDLPGGRAKSQLGLKLPARAHGGGGRPALRWHPVVVEFATRPAITMPLPSIAARSGSLTLDVYVNKSLRCANDVRGGIFRLRRTVIYGRRRHTPRCTVTFSGRERVISEGRTS